MLGEHPYVVQVVGISVLVLAVMLVLWITIARRSGK
jgi:hypothetical protein